MIVQTKSLVKKFQTGEKELTVLKGVDMSVNEGEFISIIGRSGSGKSTLLYQLGLLDRPTAGEVRIDGKDVLNISDRARTNIRLRDLGYVFQDYALVPDLTAGENVMISLLMQGASKREARKRAETVLSQVGLADRIDNLPSQLSGGEQQRVSIARAIGHNPKIIFADEPTANLDNDTALSVLGVFKELHKSGQTIIMVTHEPEYSKITDRILTLFDGEITNEEKIHHRKK